MRILILHPPWPGGGYGGRSQNRWPRKRGDRAARYPVYLGYVATLMKNDGFDVHYLDCVMKEISEKEGLERVKSLKPDVIYTESSTPTINYDMEFVKKCKDMLPNLTYIFSGSHATYFSTDVLKNSQVDIVVKGEQDFPALHTVQALRDKKPLKDVKGIAWKDNGTVVENPPAELLKDLDSLPFPDRDLIPHQDYIEGHARKKPFTFLMTSRGCPYKCTFCLWPSIFFNRQLRYRSVDNVVKEMKWLADTYGIKEIFIDDGTLNVNKIRVMQLCKGIIDNNVKMLWGCSCRVDRVDAEMLSMMKKAGCRLICYGPESASEKTLEATSKGIDISQAYSAIKLTKKAGIIAHANFMIGFPWETEKDIQDTINFAQSLKPSTIQISLAFPHPGTDLYEQAVQNDWFVDGVVGNWDRFEMSQGPVLKTNVPEEVLRAAIAKGHSQFFFRPSYILKTIFSIRSPGEFFRVLRGAHSVIKGKILYNVPKLKMRE